MIAYSRNKLMGRVLMLCLAAALILFCVAEDSLHRPIAHAVSLSFAAVAGWRALASLLKLLDKDLTAIAWNDREIRVHTLLATRQVPWRALEAVRIKRRRWRISGVPVWTTHDLILQLYDQGSTRKLSLPVGTLDLGALSLAELVARLEARDDAATGPEAPAPACNVPDHRLHGAPSRLPGRKSFGRKGMGAGANAA